MHKSIVNYHVSYYDRAEHSYGCYDSTKIMTMPTMQVTEDRIHCWEDYIKMDIKKNDTFDALDPIRLEVTVTGFTKLDD